MLTCAGAAKVLLLTNVEARGVLGAIMFSTGVGLRLVGAVGPSLQVVLPPGHGGGFAFVTGRRPGRVRRLGLLPVHVLENRLVELLQPGSATWPTIAR